MYELRQYTFRSGTLPDISKNWADSVPDRVKLSPLVLLGSVEFGPSASSFIHIWPYTSMAERNEVRRKASEARSWPPAGGCEHYLTQTNKLLLPSLFSPAQ